MDPYVENKLLCDATPGLSERDIRDVQRARSGGGSGGSGAATGRGRGGGRDRSGGGRGGKKGRGHAAEEEFDLDSYVAHQVGAAACMGLRL